MINYNKKHKLSIVVLMLIGFVILISWTAKFNFLKLEDLKLFLILIVSTLILILLGTDDLKNKTKLIGKIRFNLFLTGMLMALILLFDLVVSDVSQLTASLFILCLKPMIFALMIYLPSYNLLMIEHHDHNESELVQFELTRRELEVMDQLSLGSTNKEISVVLYIAENTVKKHIQNIMKKTNYLDRQLLIKKYKEYKSKSFS